MTRRRWLALLAAGWPCVSRPTVARAQAVPGPAIVPPIPPVPRVNGGINVQPVRRLPGDRDPVPVIDPALVELQMRAVYALGFEQLRITLPFARFMPDFFAPIPYVRAARALGIDVVGVMSDFSGYALVQALATQRSGAAVLNSYRDIFVLPSVAPRPGIPRAGEFALQVLNEPTHFLGIDPAAYVQEFLRPVNAFFKLRSPELQIVSAAEVGNVQGLYREREMLEAGLEAHCDRAAYHVYSRELIGPLGELVRRPIWITESGTGQTSQHLAWVREVFPRLRSEIRGVERVFYYVLYDLEPNAYRLLDLTRAPSGAAQARVESQALVDHLLSRVADASRGQPTAPFETLIPDITAYFPTQFDFDRAVEATPFLPPP